MAQLIKLAGPVGARSSIAEPRQMRHSKESGAGVTAQLPGLQFPAAAHPEGCFGWSTRFGSGRAGFSASTARLFSCRNWRAGTWPSACPGLLGNRGGPQGFRLQRLARTVAGLGRFQGAGGGKPLPVGLGGHALWVEEVLEHRILLRGWSAEPAHCAPDPASGFADSQRQRTPGSVPGSCNGWKGGWATAGCWVWNDRAKPAGHNNTPCASNGPGKSSASAWPGSAMPAGPARSGAKPRRAPCWSPAGGTPGCRSRQRWAITIDMCAGGGMPRALTEGIRVEGSWRTGQEEDWSLVQRLSGTGRHLRLAAVDAPAGAGISRGRPGVVWPFPETAFGGEWLAGQLSLRLGDGALFGRGGSFGLDTRGMPPGTPAWVSAVPPPGAPNCGASAGKATRPVLRAGLGTEPHAPRSVLGSARVRAGPGLRRLPIPWPPAQRLSRGPACRLAGVGGSPTRAGSCRAWSAACRRVQPQPAPGLAVGLQPPIRGLAAAHLLGAQRAQTNLAAGEVAAPVVTAPAARPLERPARGTHGFLRAARGRAPPWQRLWEWPRCWKCRCRGAWARWTVAAGELRTQERAGPEEERLLGTGVGPACGRAEQGRAVGTWRSQGFPAAPDTHCSFKNPLRRG
jgi:hypothetical protein